MGGTVCGLHCFVGVTVLWAALFCGRHCFVGVTVLWVELFVGGTVL